MFHSAWVITIVSLCDDRVKNVSKYLSETKIVQLTRTTEEENNPQALELQNMKQKLERSMHTHNLCKYFNKCKLSVRDLLRDSPSFTGSKKASDRKLPYIKKIFAQIECMDAFF